MNARPLHLVVAIGITAMSSRAAAQTMPDTVNGVITIFNPAEWTGHGVRGDGGITFSGATVFVEGLAFHPSGIASVSVAGNPANVSRDSSGATRFRVQIPTDVATREVEIVAVPVHGRPLVRVQHTDGTFIVHAADIRPAPPGLDALAPLQPLHIYLADRDDVLAAQLEAVPGVLVDAPADGAQLSIRREGGGFLVLAPSGEVRHRVGGAGELAWALAREVGALQFALLAPPPGAFRVEFGFVGGTDTFHLTGPIEFRVRSARDGYLTVIDLGTDGSIGVLFPVMGDNPRIHVGDEVILPSQAVRSFFAPDPPYRATAPTGPGLVRAFVTQRPVVLPPPDPRGIVDAGAILRALRAAIGEPAPGLSQVWSTALLTYHVVP
jgi:hypothetical protein